MEKLRVFLNSLGRSEQIRFAKLCSTSIGYLRNAIANNKKIGPKLSVKIEVHSQSEVTRKMLHPHDFSEMWPELSK